MPDRPELGGGRGRGVGRSSTEPCTDLARARGEPTAGTASRARRWVLVEQPGAWGTDALRDSALPASTAAHLQRLRRELPARILLLRRPRGSALRGGSTPDAGRASGSARIVFVASSRPDGGGWVERFDLDDVRDLEDLDLRALSAGRSVGGAPLDGPLYLVCTNGKHDPCCARYGLPVARALAEDHGEAVWECSHVGGDRFAGNLVCLPSGVLYGHLDPDTARQAVAADRAGRLELATCRGRSALSFAEQAAELAVRAELDLEVQGALELVGARQDGDLHEVRFRTADGRVVLATMRQARGKPQVLTCGTAPAAPAVHTLVHLRIGA